MFANSRMFWNVRPIPKRTISLGRALRKIPARVQQVHVPRRPDDRDDERADQEPDRRRAPAARRRPRGGPRCSRRRRRRTRPGTRTRRTARPRSRRGRATTGSPAERDRALGRLEQAGDDVEERRLARAVGADEADDRALGDVEVDRAHRDEAAEALRDPAGVERAGSVGARPSARSTRRGRAVGAGAWSHAARSMPDPRLGHPSDRSSGSIRAVGSAAVSSSSAGVSWSSRRLRRLGNRPSGRTASSRPAPGRTAGTGS